MRGLALMLLLSGCTVAQYDPTGKACDEAHACPDGWSCFQERCVAGALPCGSSVECAADQVCTGNQCGSCSANSPCYPGELCQEGRCVAQCDSTLQSLLNASTADEVIVPACVYRETLEVTRAVTLRGRPGAEIRGSDIWSSWTAQAGGWFAGPLPHFDVGTGCPTDHQPCAWPEQVFVDGHELVQVAEKPKTGQFSVDATRNVWLADDPAGHVVEVSTRARWMNLSTGGVTLSHLRMRHSAASPELGALSNDGHTHVTIESCDLSDVHGEPLALTGGGDLEVLDTTLSSSGLGGLFVDEVSGVTLKNNRVHDTANLGFEEAAGLSVATCSNVVIEDNEVFSNGAEGIEVTGESQDVVVRGNRAHHNASNGILVHDSQRVQVDSNVVYENAWSVTTGWGWAAGILVLSSRDNEVTGNVVAWNPDGICVICVDTHSAWSQVVGNFVHQNVIAVGADPNDPFWWLNLGWLQDWNGPLLLPASNNRGEANLYWNNGVTPDRARYAWGDALLLADFNATPGEERGRELSSEEKDALLGDAGVPTSPEPR